MLCDHAPTFAQPKSPIMPKKSPVSPNNGRYTRNKWCFMLRRAKLSEARDDDHRMKRCLPILISKCCSSSLIESSSSSVKFAPWASAQSSTTLGSLKWGWDSEKDEDQGDGEEVTMTRWTRVPPEVMKCLQNNRWHTFASLYRAVASGQSHNGASCRCNWSCSSAE